MTRLAGEQAMLKPAGVSRPLTVDVRWVAEFVQRTNHPLDG
jgi:hypothetical protein